MRRIIRFLFVLGLLAPVPGRADDPSRADLRADVGTVTPGRPFHLAIVIHPAPGWHTYWKNPGDSGMPATVAWHLPDGFAAGPLQWPAPARFVDHGIVGFGWTEPAWLIAEVAPPADLAPGETVTLTVDAHWLVCAEICVDQEDRLTRSLKIATESAPGDAGFEEALTALPSPAPWPVRMRRTGHALVLEADTGEEPSPGVLFYPDRDGVLDHAAEQRIEATASGLRLSLTPAPGAEPQALSGVLVLGDGRAFTLTATVPR